MLFKKNRSRRRPPKDTSIVNWIIIAGVVLAFLHNMQAGAPGAPDKVTTSFHKAVDEINAKKPISLNDYKNKVFPEQVPTFHTEDVSLGTGGTAICGQEATISYTTATQDDKPIDDKAGKDHPLTFKIGGHEVMPALEEGVIGMKPDGARKIFSPANMAYGIKKYARDDVAADTSVVFAVELLKATPALPDPKESPYRVATIRSGGGPASGCGYPAKIQITVWGIDGKKIFSTYEDGHTPITFTPGKSEAILGLEQGVIGLQQGGIRTLVIPPSFQKTMDGNEPTVKIPLPENETILVDIESVP